jgi:deoxyribodipyrimidine photo-lyase
MRIIQEERISQLNDKDVQDGDYVLYWMQEAQRASYNHPLDYAVQRANELEQPLLVVFGLTADYPEVLRLAPYCAPDGIRVVSINH